MAQVLAIAGPFQSGCPVSLQQTLAIATVTPSASSSAPFTVPQVTIDLSQSLNAAAPQVLTYSFSVPSNASSYCPSSTSTSTGTSTGATTSTGTVASGSSYCPLVPAILYSPGSAMATIEFVAGTGFYPVQVTVTDANGGTSSQVIVLAYQAPGGATLPPGTGGLSSSGVASGAGTGTGSSTGTGSTMIRH